MRDFDLNLSGIEDLLAAEIHKRAEAIAKQARSNASSYGWRQESVSAIDTEDGRDDDGAFTDVGYKKHHPGYVLWFQEVGTVHHPAKPHLRPAIDAGNYRED